MIWDLLKTNYKFSNYEIRLVRYSLLAIFSELSKFLILFFIFSMLKRELAFVTAVIVLLILRSNMGGIHFKHYLSCLFFTFMFFFISIIVLPYLLSPHTYTILFTLTLCLISNVILNPVVAPTRPEPTAKLIRKSKINAFRFIFLYIVIIYLFEDNAYLTIGFWVIVLQTLQLIFTHLIRKGNFICNFLHRS